MPPKDITETKSKKFSKEVAYLIRTLIDLNTELEEHKRDLFQNHMFSPFVAFQYIDRYNQGYITQNDFESLLTENKIQASKEEIQYLMYHKGKKETFEVDFSLSRPDTICYKSFLNMIAPKDINLLKNKFCDLTGKYEGKERLLPNYVFKHLIHVIKLEIEKFGKIEEIKKRLVKAYGYFAHSAFKLIAQNSDTIDFTNLSRYMNNNGYSISQTEYKIFLNEVDCDFDERIDKSEFLDLLTPFSSYLTNRVGNERYEDLAKYTNKEDFEMYIGNSFNPKRGVENKKSLDKEKYKEVPKMLKGIYTDQFNDPSHPINKHLFIDDNYKVNFNLRKKRFDPTATRGFNDYYNDYFKHLCHEERNEAVDLARRIVDKKRKQEDVLDTGKLKQEKIDKKTNLLEKFEYKFLRDRKHIGMFHNAVADRFSHIIRSNHGVEGVNHEKALEGLIRNNLTDEGHDGESLDSGFGYASYNLNSVNNN